jgi:hypothetical protein
MKKTRRRSKRRARLTTLDILATVLGVIAFAGEILAPNTLAIRMGF